MRWIRFAHDGTEGFGVLEGRKVMVFHGAYSPPKRLEGRWQHQLRAVRGPLQQPRL